MKSYSYVIKAEKLGATQVNGNFDEKTGKYLSKTYVDNRHVGILY